MTALPGLAPMLASVAIGSPAMDRRSLDQRKRQPRVGEGRPSKYDPTFGDALIAFCARGYSLRAFAGSIGVSRDTLTVWGRRHTDFADALGRAKAAATLCWERRLISAMDRRCRPGQAATIIFALRNLAPADYGDRRLIDDRRRRQVLTVPGLGLVASCARE